jgi:hypothetical protein
MDPETPPGFRGSRAGNRERGQMNQAEPHVMSSGQGGAMVRDKHACARRR